eukprot:TRINITY_DN73903_c0_g1_i1.p1 TRINITY_DN73903_c0_g1~~TRINITY_DN73903_c0_g1_i1.p1  ORF type:complete len:320 (+),score=76.23 TRINITY_DN73903_c0_g1_i1:71-961(+)
MAASEPDLLGAVRRAASEMGSSAAASVAGGRRRGGSQADLRSHKSHRSSRGRDRDSLCSSGYSSSSGMRGETVMTLKQMQDHVQNTAMDRYISELQRDAQAAVKANNFWEKKVQDDLEEERREVRTKRSNAQHNQNLLRHQMEENKHRRAEDRREYIEAASSHSFPLFGETFISLEEVNEYYANRKKQFRQELNDQLLCINTMKNMQKKKDRDHAEAKQRENAMQMVYDRKKERARLAEQGRDMVASWDRDIRLGNIKKAILSGKDVVRQTLGPGAVPADGASGAASAVGSQRSQH